ncbi:MAG: alpha/beta hydrolase [Nocardioides sp.]|uniref:alpha/beta hydrolase n=1 Tax=Nocardioides sp. TaxID=35761 RepID=UPI003D6C54A9
MAIARWAEPDLLDGVTQHRFVVEREPNQHVPAVAWYAANPNGRDARPLVLLGHGGQLHKLSARNVRLATRLVREHGINSVAIDGPFHGDRSPSVGFDYQAAMVERGVGKVTEQVIEDWRRTLDAIGDCAPFGVTTVGYLGLSMGARFGLSLIASVNTRISAAVLGKFGLRDGGVLHPGLNTEKSTLRAAQRVTVPVLFHVEWADEIFPRDAQLSLFDAIGSENKALYARNGRHGSNRPEDASIWLEYLARHLVEGTP